MRMSLNGMESLPITCARQGVVYQGPVPLRDSTVPAQPALLPSSEKPHSAWSLATSMEGVTEEKVTGGLMRDPGWRFLGE